MNEVRLESNKLERSKDKGESLGNGWTTLENLQDENRCNRLMRQVKACTTSKITIDRILQSAKAIYW